MARSCSCPEEKKVTTHSPQPFILQSTMAIPVRHISLNTPDGRAITLKVYPKTYACPHPGPRAFKMYHGTIAIYFIGVFYTGISKFSIPLRRLCCSAASIVFLPVISPFELP